MTRLLGLILLLATSPLRATADPLDSVYGVMKRTIGEKYTGRIKVALAPAPRGDGKDWYEISAKGGRLQINASTPIAACRGFYDYLKSACHCQVNWSGSNLKMPQDLPDFKTTKVVSPSLFRHYYNICTFGYTTAFWDWKRWEREIDWMALHGINMPLSLTGQDKVWRTTFRSFGVPDSSSMKFFSGPAFQPWHWMGNLNGHSGPPPESWILGQAELEKKILDRERDLGMTPVVSGFSGFVPTDFDRYQKVKLYSPTSWCGFAPTTFVDVRDPMFVQIGKKYVEEFRKEFGDVHYYLCDTFNEQNPQFPDATKLDDLEACGKAVYEAIRQGDPDGVWVMQGWLFYNEASYWGKPEVEALLSGVPDGKMIVLDLATYQFPVYLKQPAVAKKGWILNTLHNYGQNTALGGDLQGFADTVKDALASPDRGRMLGMGLTPEGIDQNAVVYELMTDLMWGLDGHVDVRDWITDFVSQRYGVPYREQRNRGLQDVTDAWRDVVRLLYSSNGTVKAAWRDRPNLGRIEDHGEQAQIVRRALFEIATGGNSKSGNDWSGFQMKNMWAQNPLHQRDVVDLAKTWLGMQADTYLAAALMSWPDNRVSYQKYKARFLDALEDIDAVMACRPEHRLTTWLNAARVWGKRKAEKDLMERNARMQITTWDEHDVLTDYANKEWAGLVKDFLEPRWGYFFDRLEKSETKDLSAAQLSWDLKWVNSTRPPRESKAQDPVRLVERLLDKYPEKGSTLAEMLDVPKEDPGIAVGKPVTSSEGQEVGSNASVVTDGNTMGSWWSASPPPQWVQIDLGSVRTVIEIDLFCYWRDQRFYQYKIEVSVDGSQWSTVVDASSNTALSTFRGYRHRITSAQTRYVRVTMLKNSANVGQHIHEVRVIGT